MSKNKTFSIIIPLYNKAKYICKSIDSVLVQSFDDFEIIVVDDGSTDDSKSIVQNHYKHLDNLSIITQTNAGPAAARNTGVKYASVIGCCFWTQMTSCFLMHWAFLAL